MKAYIIPITGILFSLFIIYFGLSAASATQTSDPTASTTKTTKTKIVSEPCECIASILIDPRGQISSTELYSCYCPTTYEYLYITSTPYSSEFLTRQ